MRRYVALASDAAAKQWSFLDFLEDALAHERETRQVRSRQTLVRMAGSPALKALDDYEYPFAVGAPHEEIDELAKLRFIERDENAALLGPSGMGRTHLTIAIGYACDAGRYQDEVYRGSGSDATACGRAPTGAIWHDSSAQHSRPDAAHRRRNRLSAALGR